VIAESSTYCPVLSDVRVPAQPTMTQSARAPINARSHEGVENLNDVFMEWVFCGLAPEQFFDLSYLPLNLGLGLFRLALVLKASAADHLAGDLLDGA